MTPKATKEVQRHIVLAVTYLEDGAVLSAKAHMMAAHLITRGEPVPKGADFWTLGGRVNELFNSRV